MRLSSACFLTAVEVSLHLSLTESRFCDDDDGNCDDDDCDDDDCDDDCNDDDDDCDDDDDDDDCDDDGCDDDDCDDDGCVDDKDWTRKIMRLLLVITIM